MNHTSCIRKSESIAPDSKLLPSRASSIIEVRYSKSTAAMRCKSFFDEQLIHKNMISSPHSPNTPRICNISYAGVPSKYYDTRDAFVPV